MRGSVSNVTVVFVLYLFFQDEKVLSFNPAHVIPMRTRELSSEPRQCPRTSGENKRPIRVIRFVEREKEERAIEKK